MGDDKVRLTHPRLPGAQQWAAPAAVDNWQAKGWRPDPPTTPTIPAPAAPPQVAPDPATPEED